MGTRASLCVPRAFFVVEMPYSPPAAPWRQLPEGVSVFDVEAFLDWAYSRSDPRVADWPLMQSIWPTLWLCAAYLLFVVVGKRMMRDREAFDLKGAMVIYNVIIASTNAWMFVRFVQEIIKHKYSWVCNEVDYSDNGTEVAWLVYCYYVSKVIDFSDTAFMILRRKFDQASFLHVYHHVAMFLIWWMAVKWCAGGDGIAGPVFNTFVHAVMYTYYLGTALGVHIPGKRYLTQLQITQLFSVTCHSILSIAFDCRYPQWTMYAQAAFLLSLLYLFVVFYRNAYKKGKTRKASKAE